jgi:mgtE-like transporter
MNDFKEILTSQLVAVTGGIAAGTILAFATDKIALVPGLFILMPGFLAMRGSIAGSLSARIGAALHQGHKGAQHEHSNFGKHNVHASFLLAIIASFVLGVVAYLGTKIAFGIDAPGILLIAILAAFISNLLIIPITFASTIWLFHHDYDPDNIMGPYITTVGDIISIISLLTAITLL